MNPMIDTEQATMFQQIAAQLDQISTALQALASGGGTEEPQPVQAEQTEQPVDMECKDVQKQPPEEKKEDFEKENNGPTASDSAKERLEADTTINDENFTEVGKTIMQLLKKQLPQQQKRLTTKQAPQANIAKTIANSLSPLMVQLNTVVAKQNSNELAISGILDAMGYSDEVLKTIETKNTQAVQKTQQNNLPVQSLDAGLFAKELIEQVLGTQNVSKNQNNYFGGAAYDENVKSHDKLTEKMPALFANAMKARGRGGK